MDNGYWFSLPCHLELIQLVNKVTVKVYVLSSGEEMSRKNSNVEPTSLFGVLKKNNEKLRGDKFLITVLSSEMFHKLYPVLLGILWTIFSNY